MIDTVSFLPSIFVLFFHQKKNGNIIYEGEQLLIYLVRPTTKEEKITQYDMNTDETVLI